MAHGLELAEPPDRARDHIRGDLAAPVVVVEYGCVGSIGESKEDRALRGKLGGWLGAGKVCLVFRHFPMIDSHPGAWLAARAVEAAARQGRFWEMHDALTDSLTARGAKELDSSAILAVARHVALDLARLEADMEHASVDMKILRDLHSGARSGVNGAPTFYVQGVRQDIGGPDELVERVEHALAGEFAALWPPVHEDRKIGIARRWLAGLADGDVSMPAGSWDDRIAWHGWNKELPGGGTALGRSAVEELHRRPRTAVAGFRANARDYIEHGDRLLVIGEAHSDAPGGGFDIPYVQVWEFEAGKAMRVETLTDTLAIAEALADVRIEENASVASHEHSRA